MEQEMPARAVAEMPTGQKIAQIFQLLGASSRKAGQKLIKAKRAHEMEDNPVPVADIIALAAEGAPVDVPLADGGGCP